jgi:hypothetical protein
MKKLFLNYPLKNVVFFKYQPNFKRFLVINLEV